MFYTREEVKDLGNIYCLDDLMALSYASTCNEDSGPDPYKEELKNDCKMVEIADDTDVSDSCMNIETNNEEDSSPYRTGRESMMLFLYISVCLCRSKQDFPPFTIIAHLSLS
jgi:hypothetical protein